MPESLRAAFDGVEALFLLGGYSEMRAILAEARRAGIRRVVLLTSRSAIGGNPANAIAKMWIDSEATLRDAGLPWSIVRPSGCMSNALRWAPQIRANRSVRAPFARAPVAVVDPADIAAVAAAALNAAGDAPATFAVSGPEALLPADQVRILGPVLGIRSIPAAMVDAFFRFFVDGEFDDSVVVPTVEAVTGRPARTFERWARDHAAQFR